MESTAGRRRKDPCNREVAIAGESGMPSVVRAVPGREAPHSLQGGGEGETEKVMAEKRKSCGSIGGRGVTQKGIWE